MAPENPIRLASLIVFRISDAFSPAQNCLYSVLSSAKRKIQLLSGFKSAVLLYAKTRKMYNATGKRRGVEDTALVTSDRSIIPSGNIDKGALGESRYDVYS